MYKIKYLIIVFILTTDHSYILSNPKIDSELKIIAELTLKQIAKIQYLSDDHCTLCDHYERQAAWCDFHESLNNPEYIIDRPASKKILDQYALINSQSKIHPIIRIALKKFQPKARL